jgi:hypothetical protein
LEEQAIKPQTLKLGVVAGMGLLIAAFFVERHYVDAQPANSQPTPAAQFSPEHKTVSDAVRHFLSVRTEPEQPIAFVHKVHVETVELECTDCHLSVARGPQASIPDIRTCWSCHSTTLVDHPEIKKMKEYHDKGQDIPWRRVWGWVEEAHVRFNHAPHIRAEVECATCHGDVSQMTVATRPFEHTMGFCVSCHEQKQASIDCTTCHY